MYLYLQIIDIILFYKHEGILMLKIPVGVLHNIQYFFFTNPSLTTGKDISWVYAEHLTKAVSKDFPRDFLNGESSSKYICMQNTDAHNFKLSVLHCMWATG